jgi:hypothetical protein
MPNLDDDFESLWHDLKGGGPKPLITISAKPRDYTFGLEEAAAKAEFDLRRELNHLGQINLTNELLSRLVTHGVQYFMRHWYESYRNQDVAGLVEFIMDGLNLPPEELKGMMTALPQTLIERVVHGVSGAGSGIHALFALEWHRRAGNLPSDYEIYRDEDRTKVRLIRDGQAITLTLDEVFKIQEDKPESV